MKPTMKSCEQRRFRAGVSLAGHHAVDRRHQRSIEAAVRTLEQRHGRAPTEREIAADDFLDRHLATDAGNPLGLLEDRRMREALVEAIKHLPEREQYVMSMDYEHDLNLKEIAAVLEVTESRVCQLHGQSIARLRAWLREW